MEGRWFPREVTGDLPLITLTGCEEVRVEQHRGLVAYQIQEIVFRSSAGEIRIEGNDLCLARYASDEALVTGKIASVSLQKGREGR